MTSVETDEMDPREARYFERVGRATTPEQMEDAFRRGRREVGDLVMFPSSSSPSGYRWGKIVACGPKRAKVSFKFYNGRQSQRSVPYEKLSR